MPASLTLGGIDLNRFIPNDISFDMATGFQPVVSITAISVSSDPLFTASNIPNWTGEPLSLLESSQAELYTIDSSTPFLWLPEKVCDAFALALNLTYNDTLQLYLYGDGADPSTLADWNMIFTFTIADLPGSSKTVDIILPYDAFNHQLSFPFPALNATFNSPPVNYFPLRKASNKTQYTIGRVFLQEAYLAVDYERNNFSISQAKFANDAVTNVNLAAITRPLNSIFAGPANISKSGLSTGAKVGIGVGAAIILLAIIGSAVCVCVRKRRRGRKGSSESPADKNRFFKRKSDSNMKSTIEVRELSGDKHHPMEVPADQSSSRFELPGTAPVEMPAEVPSSYYAPNKTRNGATPVELEHRSSTAKNLLAARLNGSSPSPSLPPYSPAQIGRVSGSNVSPSSSLFNRRGTGTEASSGISGISPNEASGQNAQRHDSNGLRTNSPNTQAISPPAPSPLSPPTPLDKPGNLSGLGVPRSGGEDHAVPSRTVSRSSRFREEGISTESQPEPQRPRRFSWEDER